MQLEFCETVDLFLQRDEQAACVFGRPEADSKPRLHLWRALAFDAHLWGLLRLTLRSYSSIAVYPAKLF
eukprot:938146-Prymnesium_polylepis.1